MSLYPTRTTLRLEAPPQGISGADALRSLFYGLRGLSDRLVSVSVYESSYATEAGLRTITKRSHGRASDKVDIWLPPPVLNTELDELLHRLRRGELVRAASTAVALLTGYSEEKGAIVGAADSASLETIWPLLTDIPLGELPEVGGKVTATTFNKWLAKDGMEHASLLEIEGKYRIGRATASRARAGKLTLKSVHKWAVVGGYKGDFTDWIEEMWP